MRSSSQAFALTADWAPPYTPSDSEKAAMECTVIFEGLNEQSGEQKWMLLRSCEPEQAITADLASESRIPSRSRPAD